MGAVSHIQTCPVSVSHLSKHRAGDTSLYNFMVEKINETFVLCATIGDI